MALLVALQTKVIRDTERIVETISPAPTASAQAHYGGRGQRRSTQEARAVCAGVKEGRVGRSFVVCLATLNCSTRVILQCLVLNLGPAQYLGSALSHSEGLKRQKPKACTKVINSRVHTTLVYDVLRREVQSPTQRWKLESP